MIKTAFVLTNTARESGIGHIMRTLAIAEELRAGGSSVRYLMEKECPENIAAMLRERKINVILLDPKNESLISNLDQINDGASKTPLIIDDYSYINDEELHRNLKKYFRPLVIIDDQAASGPEEADIYINPNPMAKYRGGGDAIIGVDAVMLRKDVLTAGRPAGLSGALNTILIAIGGTDPRKITESVCRIAAATLGEKNFIVVVDSASDQIEQLEAFFSSVSETENFELLLSPHNFVQILSSADLLITAGGLIVWEAGYLGIPTVVAITDDKQTSICGWLADEGAIGLAGDVSDPNFNDKLMLSLIKLKDANVRESLSMIARRKVDGLGAKRAADLILKKVRDLERD